MAGTTAGSAATGERHHFPSRGVIRLPGLLRRHPALGRAFPPARPRSPTCPAPASTVAPGSATTAVTLTVPAAARPSHDTQRLRGDPGSVPWRGVAVGIGRREGGAQHNVYRGAQTVTVP